MTAKLLQRQARGVDPVREAVDVLTRIVELFPGTRGGPVELSREELTRARQAVVDARKQLGMNGWQKQK